MQLPPQIAMPCARAIAASRSVSSGTPSRGSSYPLAKITALPAPASAARRSCSSSSALETARITRSTGSAISATEATHGNPRISSYLGFTGTIRPPNPPSISSTTLWLPTEPSRTLAPTTATERASSMRSIALRPSDDAGVTAVS